MGFIALGAFPYLLKVDSIEVRIHFMVAYILEVGINLVVDINHEEVGIAVQVVDTVHWVEGIIHREVGIAHEVGVADNNFKVGGINRDTAFIDLDINCNQVVAFTNYILDFKQAIVHHSLEVVIAEDMDFSLDYFLTLFFYLYSYYLEI